MALRITIDGPAGAGKSTVARALARRLGITYLDTGAMYRALTLKVLACGVSALDSAAVFAILQQSDICIEGGSVWLDGSDVTGLIRTQAIDEQVSDVARHPAVRHEMVERQRALAAAQSVVMDGRDAGTEILPDAEFKVYLTASLAARARRRAREAADRNSRGDLETVEKALARRDQSDATRAVGALKAAADAICIDSTDMSVDEVVAFILAKVCCP